MSTATPTPPRLGTHWRDKERGMAGEVIATAAIYPPDEREGWRIVTTYPLAVAGSTDYQSAHSQAASIREGRRAYIRNTGMKFDARVTKGDHALLLWVRCLGEDGKRWEA